MSVAPRAARARPAKTMSESGDPGNSAATVRVEDIERAVVLAREVASATAGGGPANLRMEHLNALFANGNGPVPPGRIQAALEAAGLAVEPSLSDSPDTVTLRVTRGRATLSPSRGGNGRRLSGLDAYQAASGKPKAAGGVPLADAQRRVVAERAEHNTAQSIAGLLPATIVPVLAASFLGPLFGAAFAGLALVASALLSRPGALADGKLGPIRMPASLARSFLLVSFGVALGALLTSVALVAAGERRTEPSDESAPIEQPREEQPRPQQTTPPAPPSAEERRKAAEARRDRRERAERRRERAKRAERRRERRERRERAEELEETPPSGGGTQAPEPEAPPAPETGTSPVP